MLLNKLKSTVELNEANKVLFDTESGVSYKLNSTAFFICILLLKHQELEAIERQLAEKYKQESSDIKADIMDFIAQLRFYELTEE